MENNIIRVTKAQKLSAIKSFIPEDAHVTFPGNNDPKNPKAPYEFSYSEIIAFLDAELDLLARKNTSANGEKKLTDTQKENERYKELIVEFLAGLPEDHAGMTCSEIIKSIPELNGFGTQKVSPLLKQLKDASRVVSAKGKKGATLFKLA